MPEFSGLDRDHLVGPVHSDDTRTSTPIGFDGDESFNSSEGCRDSEATVSANSSDGKISPGLNLRCAVDGDVGRQLFSGDKVPNEEDFECIKVGGNIT